MGTKGVGRVDAKEQGAKMGFGRRVGESVNGIKGEGQLTGPFPLRLGLLVRLALQRHNEGESVATAWPGVSGKAR
jgi:hypothetical protein